MSFRRAAILPGELPSCRGAIRVQGLGVSPEPPCSTGCLSSPFIIPSMQSPCHSPCHKGSPT